MLAAVMDGFSEAVAADGRVWFVDGAGYTFCYAIEGGEPIWSHFGGAPITARPTLTANTAYVANVDGVVFALDASTGEVRWRYQRPTDASRQSDLTLFGAPSPVVVDDELLVASPTAPCSPWTSPPAARSGRHV